MAGWLLPAFLCLKLSVSRCAAAFVRAAFVLLLLPPLLLLLLLLHSCVLRLCVAKRSSLANKG